MTDGRDRIAARLEEAGVGSDRLINVLDGEKASHDHTHLTPERVSGNYGVHAEATDELVMIDVDDYRGLDDKSGFSALSELPPTLEEETPHGGTHRFYAVPPTDSGLFIAAVLENEFGTMNPNPSWGEVRVAGQYVVAAGSQLDGCEKEWCDECGTEDGGQYKLTNDREIAEVSADTLVDVLQQDPKLSENEDVEESDDGAGQEAPEPAEDADEIIEWALEESNDDKLRRLWRGDYSDYNGDRSAAESALAYKLAFWLGGDKRAVRRAMDRANTKKWDDRTDDSYRESVLEAVDECSTYYDPSSGQRSSPDAATADGAGATSGSGGRGRPLSDQDQLPLSPLGVMHKAFSDIYGRLRRNPDSDEPDPDIHDLRNSEAATYTWEVLEDRGEENVIGVSDGSLRAYESGVWTREGNAAEQYLRRVGQQAVKSKYSSQVLEQLKEQARGKNGYHVDELGIDEPWLVVGDQALNLKNRETREVEREDLALRRINAEYDPGAEPDLWLDFLSRVAATPETIKKVQEYFGYCLWVHGQPFGKALFLVGDTDSGKGTALKTLETILGRRKNVANEALQDLIETRWGKAELHGRIANIRNEVTPGGVENVEEFKELLGGGDRVSAEFKGQDKFQFEVTQKFLFATNQFPDVENADRAFWNRCLFARFPETIPEEDQRPNFHDELLEERSGILNWMLDGLDRLFDQAGFTGERAIADKKTIAEEVGSPLERLKQDALTITREPDDLVHARDLYDLAVAYADSVDMDDGLPPWKGGAFTSELRRWPGVDKGRSRRLSNDGEATVYKGLRVDQGLATELNVEVRTDSGPDAGQTGLDV